MNERCYTDDELVSIIMALQNAAVEKLYASDSERQKYALTEEEVARAYQAGKARSLANMFSVVVFRFGIRRM